MTGGLRRAGRALQDFLAVQVELHERMARRDRPWEEEPLHWSADGRLHGSFLPVALLRPGSRPTPPG